MRDLYEKIYSVDSRLRRIKWSTVSKAALMSYRTRTQGKIAMVKSLEDIS